jgi:hypothetical protein
MHRKTGILVTMLIILLASCHQQETPVPVNVQPTTAESAQIEPFDKPVVIFIYPDKDKSDSLQQKIGSDQFYAFSDKNGARFTEVRRLAEANNLTTWSGNASKYRFETPDGALIEMDLSRMAPSWNVILFNGQDTPVLADPEKAADLLKSTFNIRETKTGLRKRIEKRVAAENEKIIQETRLQDTSAAMPGMKSNTIRLLIFPGQKPPADRDAASDIRVVNSYISPGHKFWLQFDNDMFSNTDRYYTNGVVLGYTAPALTNWSLNRLMINRNRNSVVHAAISLNHAMFTPLTTKEVPTLSADRPYASTMYLRYSQTSEDAISGIRLSSAIEAGVIGDAALGRYFQKAVHATIPTNDEPLGWETQIKNDLVLNFTVDLQKQLLNTNSVELYAEGSASAGTLHTGASMGLNALAGKFRPGLTPLPLQYEDLKKAVNRWQYGVRGGFEIKMIGYDATLQGGLFNRNNIYALKSEEIERLVAAIHFGLFANYKKLGISLSQYYLSREFRQGRQHFWGQIGLEYGW